MTFPLFPTLQVPGISSWNRSCKFGGRSSGGAIRIVGTGSSQAPSNTSINVKIAGRIAS